MKIVVFGATGGTGRMALGELVARGHDVSALVRRPEALEGAASQVHVIQGDALSSADVARAVRGQDAVVVTLGIRENPLLVRLRGSATTAMDVRSAGSRNIIAAMREHGVRRLVVQSSYGVGDTRSHLSLKWRLIFALLLKPQIADTEAQERIVRDSDLDWVLVQPVGLTDAADEQDVFISTEAETHSMSVSRRSVARFLADAAESPQYVRQSVALSA